MRGDETRHPDVLVDPGVVRHRGDRGNGAVQDHDRRDDVQRRQPHARAAAPDAQGRRRRRDGQCARTSSAAARGQTALAERAQVDVVERERPAARAPRRAARSRRRGAPSADHVRTASATTTWSRTRWRCGSCSSPWVARSLTSSAADPTASAIPSAAGCHQPDQARSRLPAISTARLRPIARARSVSPSPVRSLVRIAPPGTRQAASRTTNGRTRLHVRDDDEPVAASNPSSPRSERAWDRRRLMLPSSAAAGAAVGPSGTRASAAARAARREGRPIRRAAAPPDERRSAR